MFKTIITGGFLSGKRTYILGALLAAQAVANWAVGEATLGELVAQLPEILGGLGFMSMRAAVSGLLETVRSAEAK